jgi:hypothetical protein
MKTYKWTAGDKPIYGQGTYDQAGAWQECEGALDLCRRGYHACTREQVPLWCGPELWEVELGGYSMCAPDKVCARRLRFVRKLKWSCADMIEYAQWCAGRAKGAANQAAAEEASAAASDAADYVVAATQTADAVAATRAAAQTAAWAATRAADAVAATQTAAWAAERAAQLAWIEGRIGEKLE